MNINYEKCKKIISLLDNYFQNEENIAEVEYPSSVVYGSNDYFLYMFYSCLLDYGMRSKIYHQNLIHTYMQYPYIFNPSYVVTMSEEELKDILVHHVHPRYPNVAVKKWIVLSNKLLQYDDLIAYLKKLDSFQALDNFIKSIPGYGQKTGGLLIRIIYDSNICNFKYDLEAIPIDRHDIEVSYLTGIVDSDKLSQKEIKILSDTYIMVAKDLNFNASIVDRYLWEIGNHFCTKKDCADCPLKNVCRKK